MGCVVNVCQTPVCTTFNYQSTPFAPFSRAGQEEVIVSASASGQSIAYAHSATGTCEMFTVFLADETAPDSGTRLSTSAEWSNANAPAAPPGIGDWDHKPFADCRTLVATGASAGGCMNQDIYFLYRQ